MVEILQNLYRNFYNESNPSPESTSKELMDFYKYPESVFAALEILQSTAEYRVKFACAIGLNLMLKNNWESFCKDGTSESIKDRLISILDPSIPILIRRNLVYSFDSILNIEKGNWPSLISFSLSLLDGKTADSLEMAFSLLDVIIPNISDDNFDSICAQVIPSLLFVVQNPNEEVVESASHVLSKFFSLYPQYGEDLTAILYPLIHYFHKCLMNNRSIGTIISSDLADIFGSDYAFVDSQSIVSDLICIASDPKVPIASRPLVFDLINPLIKNAASEMQEISDQLIRVAMNLSAESFIDDDLDKQESIFFIMETISTLSEFCDRSQIYEFITQNASDNTPAEIITFSSAICAMTETAPEIIAQNVNFILSFALKCLPEDQIDCIRESGFELLDKLLSRKNPAFESTFQQILEQTIGAIRSESETLVKRALSVLASLMESAGIDSQNINIVFECLAEMTELLPQSLMPDVIDAFSSLIVASEDHITPYAETIISFLVPLTNLSLPEQAPIRSSAILALSHMISYYPDPLELFDLFVECAKSDDYYLIQSGMESLCIATACPNEMIWNHISSAIEASTHILESQITLDDNENAEAANAVIIQAIQSTMDFVCKVAKRVPSLVSPYISNLKALIEQRICDPIPEIGSSAMKAATTLNILTPDDIESFLKHLIRDIEDVSISGTALVFSAFEKLIFNGVNISSNAIEFALEYAMQGMRRELACQDYEGNETNYDIDLGTEIYRLFSTAARLHPILFPAEDFWHESQRLMKNGNPYEASEAVGVLSEYFCSYHMNLQSLMKKSLVRFFISSLSLCDLFNPPDPIFAVRIAIECEPELCTKYIPDILTKIDEFFFVEFDNQVHYHLTMQYTVSVLFSIFRCILLEQFDLDKYMIRMLSFLPPNCGEVESANIYISLAHVCTEFSQIMGKYGNTVLKVLSLTLAAKESVWKDFHFSSNVFKAIAVLFTNLADSAQSRNLIDTIITQDIEMDRINKRLELAEEME